MAATLSPPRPPPLSSTLALVLIFYLVVTILHVVLPGPRVEGYACDWSGSVLTYRLNGFLILACVLGVFLFAIPQELATYAAENWWDCVIAANILGLLGACLLLKLPLEPSFRCLTVDQAELRRMASAEEVSGALTPAPERNIAQHFFFGRAFNPRLFGIDLKMLLYALGAAALVWNLCSALALRLATQGELSLASMVYSGMLLWFAGEYMLLEVVHLYTYDLFCEKLGFKLCWGCLVFYPFFYCIGVWPLVYAPATADMTPLAAIANAALFLCGWVMTRGANMQKFFFKRYGSKAFLFGAIKNETIAGTKGRLLCSGFWGAARHINYLGEIVQAIAMAIPGTVVATTTYYTALPWLYPLYYVALFIPRQIDDDAQIQAKYGAKIFADYTWRVPYRILPGVY